MKSVFQYTMRTTFIALVLALIFPSALRASWYGENVDAKDGRVDLMMMDVRYPYWPVACYNAFWNTRLVNEQNKTEFYFYGGWSMGVAPVEGTRKPNLDPKVQDAFHARSVWSFWGKNKDGIPVTMPESSEYTYPLQYVGEGASGSMPGTRPSLWNMTRRSSWFTQLVRTWQPLTTDGKAPDHAFVGRWFKDVENNRWYLYGIARIPSPVVGFNGNAQFLEDAGGGNSVTAQERRLGYYRKDGGWFPSDTVTITPKDVNKVIWVTQLTENDSVLSLEMGVNSEVVPFLLKDGLRLATGEDHHLTVKQPATPTLDPPILKNAVATGTGREVRVSWELAEHSSPQFGYRLEILPAEGADPVATVVVHEPTARAVVVPSDVKNPLARFTLIDVFDQEATPLTLQLSPEDSMRPAVAEATPDQENAGLTYELFANDQADTTAAPLSYLQEENRIGQGISQGYDASLAGGRKTNFGFRMKGLLQVPETGIYLIHAKAADGLRLDLAGQTLFHNDKQRGPARQTAALHLEKGFHPVEIDCFFINQRNATLQLEWESATMPRREISGADFFHLATGTPTPSVQFAVAQDDPFAPKITLDLDPRGADIKSIAIYLDGMRIAETRERHLEIKELLPSGRHQMYARVIYDAGMSIDSTKIDLVIPRNSLNDWETTAMGEADARFNVLETEPGVYEFIGEGEFRFTRPIEGDFTLTAKIDRQPDRQPEPKALVNPASRIGITAGPDQGKWRPINLYQTVKSGLRASPDFSDLNASGTSRQAFPTHHRWLRLVRKGGAMAMWTSADGTKWEFGSVYSRPFPPKMQAGIMLRVLPQDSQAFFRATVSNVSLVPGVAPELAVPTPPTAEGTANADWLGVVAAPSDPAVVVLRSDRKGLNLSRDGGKSWHAVHGNLPPAALQVRSVAIDPTNPAIIWQATHGGLFRTKDSGNTWEKLGFPGDFDATGPSGLCGEIIAIHPRDPQIVVIGSESKGLFRSADGGASWQQIHPAGERFTFVGFHPNDLIGANGAPLVATTCADRWMSLLGRGKPSTQTAGEASRSYVSHNDGASITKPKQVSSHLDFGFFNAALGAYKGMRVLYGTSHGLAYTVDYGGEVFLLSSWAPTEPLRPMSAVGARHFGVLATPLNPQNPARLTDCNNPRGLGGRWLNLRGPADSSAWLKIAPADLRENGSEASRCWILRADGLFALDLKSGATTKMTPSILLGTSNCPPHR